MAISWVTALKLVPWSDVIQATPHVLKAAKGLLKKSPEEASDGAAAAPTASVEMAPPAHNAGELALQQIAQLEARVVELEQAQHASALLIQQMAQQQSQIVQTVGLLRTGATRLAWACGILGVAVIGLLIHVWRG